MPGASNVKGLAGAGPSSGNCVWKYLSMSGMNPLDISVAQNFVGILRDLLAVERHCEEKNY